MLDEKYIFMLKIFSSIAYICFIAFTTLNTTHKKINNMEDLSKVIVQEDFSYGPHDLQSFTVYNPVGSSHNEDGYFLM